MSQAQLMRRASHRAASTSCTPPVRGIAAGRSTSLQIASLHLSSVFSCVCSDFSSPSIPCPAPRNPLHHSRRALQLCRITNTSQEIYKQLWINEMEEDEIIKLPNIQV